MDLGPGHEVSVAVNGKHVTYGLENLDIALGQS